ncbi:MAG: hypothetical protein JKY41_05740 [Rhodobacteraceae bacterium]|nr:hypothetical protein [Paracoccaceae bacterium]
MAGRIVHISDRARAKPVHQDIPYYPSSQTAGSEWIISALNDLAEYCAFNEIRDVETTLRRAIWEATLQLEQAEAR